ncbi:hypothetical protein [Nonomuraea sp. LPB2021202275-12-8]|uniref:hypothetical protein n=1 Tax=Nonomuraea sp. LPB2021202275-12-8 TaxID=3120159 RepID=UPI00300CF776
MGGRQRAGGRGVLGAGPEPGSSGPDEDGSRGGPIDEVTGLRDWYEPGDGLSVDSPAVTWTALLERWALIEADLHECYGLDLDAPGLLTSRTWRWLRIRIFGLLKAETRIARALAPDDDKPRHRR